MASVPKKAAKSASAAKPAKDKRKRLAQSVRKHIRHTKAALRRELAPADAEKAIEQLVTRLRK